MVARFDRGTINTDAIVTEEGYIRAKAIVTRAGVFTYRNPDGTIRRELRHPDDVFKADSLDTMKMIPITNDHPPERLVNAKNAKKLAIGYTGENIAHDNAYVASSLVITDEEGVKMIQEQGKKELSLGYTVDLVPEEGVFNGDAYDHRQTNIKYNHLSLVDKARAGAVARINLDADDAEEVEDEEEEEKEDKMEKEDKKKEDKKAKNDSLSTINLDGKNYDASKEVISHINSIKNDMTKLTAERDSLKERLDESEKRQKFSQKEIQKEIQKAVKETVQLVEVAKQVLDAETLEGIENLDKQDVQKLVIKARFPNAKLDSADEVYIQARYDACVEDLPKRKSDAVARANEALTTKTDSQPKKDRATEARLKLIESYKKQ